MNTNFKTKFVQQIMVQDTNDIHSLIHEKTNHIDLKCNSQDLLSLGK